jgi:hypothetical protein
MNYEPEMPRSAEIINEQLKDLQAIIDSTPLEDPLSAAEELIKSNFQVHKAELLEELKAAEFLKQECDFELTISSSMAANQAVPAGFLGKLLDLIQTLRLICAAAAGESGRSSARLAAGLIEKTKFMIDAFDPSSAPSPFTVRLVYEPSFYHFSLFETERPGEDIFLTLFKTNYDIEELTKISNSPLMCNKYIALLNLISANDAIISIRSKKYPFSNKIDSAFTRNITQLLNDTRPASEEEILIEGTLVMGDIKNNSFRIISAAAAYRGSVSEQGSAGLQTVPLGSSVRAALLRTVSPEDHWQLSYTLLSLEPISD